MTKYQNKFYECENEDCQLRFPGYDGFNIENRCPRCRSHTHEVATADEACKQNINELEICNYSLYALLDNIRSAWNVGSIFRTSDGLGVKKIFLCGISPSPDNLKVRKTALGTEFNIPWIYSPNGLNTALSLKSEGFELWALENLPSAIPLFQIDINEKNPPLVLVVGNEKTGVDPGIINQCDRVLSIPMVGKKKSYNVATAFGIAASFIIYRQRFSQGSRNILPNI
jgi:tRNA G18 (ribose-2'-O)-methylase SpoU